MDAEKIGLTIFDILGYLLTGYVMVFVLSLIEAIFLKSGLITLSVVGGNIFLFTVVAYFLGIVCHALSTLTKDKFYKLFAPKNGRLNPLIYNRFVEAIADTFKIYKIDDDKRLHTLDNYLLADSYILTEGCGEERMSLMVREGFFKTSMCAFFFLTLTSLASLFFGGLYIQPEAGKLFSFGIIPTLFIFALSAGITLLFRNRFIYYNRIKLNNTALIFLACYSKQDNKTSTHEISE